MQQISPNFFLSLGLLRLLLRSKSSQFFSSLFKRSSTEGFIIVARTDEWLSSFIPQNSPFPPFFLLSVHVTLPSPLPPFFLLSVHVTLPSPLPSFFLLCVHVTHFSLVFKPMARDLFSLYNQATQPPHFMLHSKQASKQGFQATPTNIGKLFFFILGSSLKETHPFQKPI